MKKIFVAIFAIIGVMFIIGITASMFTRTEKEIKSETLEQNNNVDFLASQIVETFTSEHSHAVANIEDNSVMVYVYVDDIALTVETSEFDEFCENTNTITNNCRTATNNELHFWIFVFDSARINQPLHVSFNGEDVTEDF